MKKILIAGCAFLLATLIQAQQKEARPDDPVGRGKVTYERVIQMQIRIDDGHAGDEIQSMLPKTRKDNFELIFGNNKSLWKAAEKADEEETGFGGDNSGVQIRMVVAGADDVLYNNFETAKRTEQREFLDKKFIIADSIRPLKWKMTNETKTILNHNCMKATATSISTRMQMNMENGKMERKEIEDTANITAWFAADIPVSAGPAEYQGQLPGLILEMDVNNGRQTFKALEISSKADLALIKEPTGKKHYTPAEFRKEREKMMDEMQRNNTGGNRQVIRMN